MRAASLARIVLVTTTVLVVSAIAMAVYVVNALDGRLDHHVLASETFGVPADLAGRGVTARYASPVPGWTGQFYFYIANDPLLERDTRAHLDADAVRYRRIGVPAIAWLASRSVSRDWVDPFVYYATSLVLVVVATWSGAAYLVSIGATPWWMLGWAFSPGVQATLMNGVPDAGADALFILAAVALLRRRPLRFACLAALAALSREAYVLLPAATLLAVTMSRAGAPEVGGDDPPPGPRRRLAIASLFAIGVFVAWQVQVWRTLGSGPWTQSGSPFGVPFLAWIEYALLSIRDHHPLFPTRAGSLRELAFLVAFAALVAGSAWTAIATLRRRTPRARPETTAFALAIVGLALFAAASDDRTMQDFGSYLPAAGAFFVAMPFLWTFAGAKARSRAAALFVAFFVLTIGVVWHGRIADDAPAHEAFVDDLQQASKVPAGPPAACLADFHADVALVGIKPPGAAGIAGALANARRLVVDVAYTNRTAAAFPASRANGSVNAAYRWLSEDGRTIVSEGSRSFVPGGIAPQATRIVPLVVDLPQQPGRYVLRLTLVQEQCAWFSDAVPASKLDLAYRVR